MKNKLEKIIEKYKNSPTSLEAYQAISDFVKIVLGHKEFLKQIEKEGETIRKAQIELNDDKGWNRGLRGKELKEHNRWRDTRYRALHDLDPTFPLHNLRVIYEWMKPENRIKVCDLLFKSYSPDDPLPDYERKEFQLYLDKVYKKILPYLKTEKTEAVEATAKDTKWENITIRFLNTYDVKIENGKETSETNYEEMGFADRRSGKAILSWDFLQLLSTNKGVFPLGRLSKEDNATCKTQKKDLSGKLKTFFKIKEDPFEEYDREKKEYRIKLKLVPHPTFRADFRDRRIKEEFKKNDKFEGIGDQFAEDTNRI